MAGIVIESVCIGFLVANTLGATCIGIPLPKKQPAVVTIEVCQPVRSWSKEYKVRVADEAAKLPADSVLREVVVDNHQSRKISEACKARQKK